MRGFRGSCGCGFVCLAAVEDRTCLGYPLFCCCGTHFLITGIRGKWRIFLVIDDCEFYCRLSLMCVGMGENCAEVDSKFG